MTQTLLSKISTPLELLTIDEEFQEDSYKILSDWFEKLIPRFFKSKFCSKWEKRQFELARLFIGGFVDYTYGCHLAKPFQWNKEIVTVLCDDPFPRNIPTNEKDYQHVACIFIAFFQWAQQEGIIQDAEPLCAEIKKPESNIYEAPDITEN